MHSLRTKFSHPAWFILALTVAGYGLLLPHTGFYWDDWPFAWIAKFLGPSEFIPAFAPFRPFLGPIFFVTASLIPPIPVFWQIFALMIRFAMGLCTWWTFKQIWPDRSRLAVTAASFLTIFPGYSQHWVAYTHINQELIPFIFLILSFGLTFKAIRAQRPFVYTTLALLMQTCGIFPTEYFFGLEGLRGLFLFSNTRGNMISRSRATIKNWWPYLLVWIMNGSWLVYYYRFGPYNSYEVTAGVGLSRLNLVPEILETLWKVCIYIWGQVLVLIAGNIFAPSSLLTLGLIVATFFLGLQSSNLFQGEAEDRNFAMTLILIGVTGILLGRLPSLAAGLPLRLQSSYDRFMVSMMVGGSLFITGLIELIFRRPRLRTMVISLMLSLGVGQQFFNANIFRRDWENQKEIYWELSWRIPALEPDTVLLAYQMPIDYETDLSFTAPINWMYARDISPPKLPFALLYTEKRLGGSTLPSLGLGVPIRFPYRTMQFDGSTSQAVVIYKPTNGCLRVLDPLRIDQEVYANEPVQLKDAIPLSSLDRIILDPVEPATPSFLLVEPASSWCYYFTRAELAYQMQDMDRVISLQKEAGSLGYQPQDLNEWLIFIEAHALTGNLDEAGRISEDVLKSNARMRRGVCTVWMRLRDGDRLADRDRLTQILSDYGCNQ